MQEDTYRGSTADPLSLNVYTYCHNSPIRYDDPTGHVVSSWDKDNLSSYNQAKIKYGNSAVGRS